MTCLKNPGSCFSEVSEAPQARTTARKSLKISKTHIHISKKHINISKTPINISKMHNIFRGGDGMTLSDG